MPGLAEGCIVGETRLLAKSGYPSNDVAACTTSAFDGVDDAVGAWLALGRARRLNEESDEVNGVLEASPALKGRGVAAGGSGGECCSQGGLVLLLGSPIAS